MAKVTTENLSKSLKYLKDNVQMYAEYERLKAQLHKEKYDALIACGFDGKQALELCKNIL